MSPEGKNKTKIWNIFLSEIYYDHFAVLRTETKASHMQEKSSTAFLQYISEFNHNCKRLTLQTILWEVKNVKLCKCSLLSRTVLSYFTTILIVFPLRENILKKPFFGQIFN